MMYEEDHLIPLSLGGHPNDPRNLWPEAPPSPNGKDKVEDELHKKVCSGQMTLQEAQRIISTDWWNASANLWLAIRCAKSSKVLPHFCRVKTAPKRDCDFARVLVIRNEHP